MSPHRKKRSSKKRSLKKKSQRKLKQKSKRKQIDQGIDNKIKRQSKLISILEYYIKDINTLEKTINNLEKNKGVKKVKSIKKSKKTNIRHDIPFDISMIKPNYQKTKRTMLEKKNKITETQDLNNILSPYPSDISSPEPELIYSLTPNKTSRKNIPNSAINITKSPVHTTPLSIINESNESSSDESYKPSSSESGSGSDSFESSSDDSTNSSPSSPRQNLLNKF